MDHDVLKQPPRNVKEPMITKDLIINVLLSSSIIIAGTLFIFIQEVSFQRESFFYRGEKNDLRLIQIDFPFKLINFFIRINFFIQIIFFHSNYFFILIDFIFLTVE